MSRWNGKKGADSVGGDLRVSVGVGVAVAGVVVSSVDACVLLLFCRRSRSVDVGMVFEWRWQ